MTLVDWQIKDLCEKGLVKPFDNNLINPSSIDIRIGVSAIIDTPRGLIDSPEFYQYTYV
jgi:deoxycytidine triphosphate deaminase